MCQTQTAKDINLENDIAIANFREYLRIPTVHPNVNYNECINFLKHLATELNLPHKVLQYRPNKPLLIVTWLGQNPTLPSILLNSHMDVVPVYKEYWTYDPFAAEMDDEGNIYARGSQDMKCVGILYLTAIGKLKDSGYTPQRSMHVSFVPDEEIGGLEGMKLFVDSKDFQMLNVGFALDEGCASPNDNFYLFNGERTYFQMRFCCKGDSGHASIVTQNTAGEKLVCLLNKLYDFRAAELNKRSMDTLIHVGDIITLNATKLEGGIQTNVIPAELSVVVDCRVPHTVDLEDFKELIITWCNEVGEGSICVEFLLKEEHVPFTPADETNPFWIAFEKASNQLNISVTTTTMAGCTDARFLRARDIPCFGFSPINRTEIKAHDHDEFLNYKVFLRGICIYCAILAALGDVAEPRLSQSTVQSLSLPQ